MNPFPADWHANHCLDGGETGCGELILELHLAMRKLESGSTLAVRALDEGAPVEIPAWCRLCQHRLVEARHPFYLINKV
ncbi:MAG: sulfurtransferase TusA family protein [Verrucomicrobiae bacterium]|nr:sulfurtransferase TusA family protein [Verrucomicrobiae bacterium]